MKRTRMLIKNYYEAKCTGHDEGFDIKQVHEDNFEEYYVLLKPKYGIYRDQAHIIHLKTSYGSNKKITYPINPPLLKFLTTIEHVNISVNGSICLDILKESTKWMPTYSFSHVMFNLMLLYQQSNTSSPFNAIAARKYTKCMADFKNKKTNDMTEEQVEQLREQCFKSYKDSCDEYYLKHNTVILGKYAKWFPELIGGESTYDKDLAELKEIYDNIKPVDTAEKKPKKKSKKKRWQRHRKN